jgi:hypothetical protein
VLVGVPARCSTTVPACGQCRLSTVTARDGFSIYSTRATAVCQVLTQSAERLKNPVFTTINDPLLQYGSTACRRCLLGKLPLRQSAFTHSHHPRSTGALFCASTCRNLISRTRQLGHCALIPRFLTPLKKGQTHCSPLLARSRSCLYRLDPRKSGQSPFHACAAGWLTEQTNLRGH